MERKSDKKLAVAEFPLIDESLLKSRIYTIRGVKVMIDADLAEIYGYRTKAFNQQVKNNIEKFDKDFRFQLSRKEYREILGSKLDPRTGKIFKNKPLCLYRTGHLHAHDCP